MRTINPFKLFIRHFSHISRFLSIKLIFQFGTWVFLAIVTVEKKMGTQVSKIFRTSKMASSAEIQQFIKDAITQEKVVVFSKSYCPYCTTAKEVFESVKQPFKVIELDQRDDGSEIQGNLAQITGFRTVPQVFINGTCVGGGSDVKALYTSGKLEAMLIG